MAPDRQMMSPDRVRGRLAPRTVRIFRLHSDYRELAFYAPTTGLRTGFVEFIQVPLRKPQ